MATFLELVNKVERESGTVDKSQRLGTVVDAPTRQEKFVHWTAQAWEMIQRSRRDWTFRRKAFSGALVAGTATYSASDLGILDFASWYTEADGYEPFTIYDTATGRSDETRLAFKDYHFWRDCYGIGVPTETRPNIVAVDWERKLCFGPTPDAAYTVRGSYRRTIQTLAADGDEPYIAAEYHDAIVWRALMLLAEHDEASLAMGTAASQFRQFNSAMIREYTEAIEA